ncbi:hypothetical protein [Clostridium fungisolvens]|uniref:Uncharacterized protein n=1 Tax=Clostridium fungisolvens TaxID=1604897 RepID=A0A6V8SF86_9CLOT|nr:hypothetical protein [Clostridium fungisolvens]GFP75125.1 hypothetical protein bsdtw1_01196 [Clostridium fungisolvens]
MNIKRKKILITLTAIISIVIISSFLIVKSMVSRFNKLLDPVTLININWSASLPNTKEATVLSDKTGGFHGDGVKLTKLNYTKDHLDEINKNFNFSSFDSLALDKFKPLAKSIDDKKAINEITDLIVNDNTTLRYKLIEEGASYLLILMSTKSSDTLTLYCLEDRI